MVRKYQLFKCQTIDKKILSYHDELGNEYCYKCAEDIMAQIVAGGIVSSDTAICYKCGGVIKEVSWTVN